MLLSQSLLQRGHFYLDEYIGSPLDVSQYAGNNTGGLPIQLEVINHHIYYYYPPGSSILSVPLVAAMDVAGISPLKSDGTYDRQGEQKIQTFSAALLMAALATLFFCTSRLVLPKNWSVLIAMSGALGTQIWSTASRGLWSITWELLLLGIVVLILLAGEIRIHRINAPVLATLLAWAYFVRPTASIPLFIIAIYLLCFYRKLFKLYVITVIVWLTGFVAYSWYIYGKVLPNYYLISRLRFDGFGTALAGNLISPSRGLFVYVPILFFVIYLLARYSSQLPYPRLVTLASVICAGQVVVVSSFPHWWGGHSYGARLTTELIPWFILMGVLGLRAMLNWRNVRGPSPNYRMQLVLGGCLLFISALINGRGAISQSTWEWNVVPANIDEESTRLWDWRQPQFLAGLVPPPFPDSFPNYSFGTRLDLGTTEADEYLWRDWGGPEESFRWTTGHKADVIFSLKEPGTAILQIRIAPFLVPHELEEQRVHIDLNGQRVTTLVLTEPRAKTYSIILPGNVLHYNNVLTLDLPNAGIPSALGLSDDKRLLGVAVSWLRLRRQDQGLICDFALDRGWYDLEQGDSDWWRWTDHGGRIAVFASQDGVLYLEGEIVSVRFPNTVDVLVSGKKESTVDITWAGFKSFPPLALRLIGGENTIEFVSHNPAITIPTDNRPLAIAVKNLSLTTSDAVSCELQP